MSKLLRNFKRESHKNNPDLKKFLKKFDEKKITDIDPLVDEASKKTWSKVDCLDCANCCKVMTPTFTKKDVTRISAYLNMSEKAFTEKWLMKDEDNGDMVNKIQPCQFLDLKTNMCSIYEVRPYDCAKFPHFKRKPFDDFNHIHEQNIEYCPATYEFITLMKEKIESTYVW